MSGSISFSGNFFVSASYLNWRQMSTGDTTGLVNNPAEYSAVSALQLIDTGTDVDMFAITLVAGQTITLDLDLGAGDASPVDTEINVIDAAGKLVATGDDSISNDAGSVSTLDPKLTFTAAVTGIYYVSVAEFAHDYVNGTFSFDTGGNQSGDYRFVVSTPFLPTLVVYGAGIDNIVLGALPDRIDLGDGADVASLGGGNDYAYGGSGADIINGGDGDDNIDGGNNTDTLHGDNGNDVITALSVGAQAFGDAGNDQIITANVAGCLADGGAGDDMILAVANSGGKLSGATGVDTLNLLDNANAVTVDLTANTVGGFLAGTTISGFENVIAGSGVDTLTGNGLTNRLTGGGGGDQLYGRGGNDTLIGGLGADAMDGEGGTDTADYSHSAGGVTVNLATNINSGGDAQGDFLQNIENIIGSDSSDSLTGNDLANVLTGDSGSDTLDGGNGNDTMIGGTGNDTYFVRQAGDVIVEASGDNGDVVRSFLAAYTLGANLEALQLFFTGNANGSGNASANTIIGNDFNNVIDGKAGADVMRGDKGNDIYFIDNSGDAIVDGLDEGTDKINSSVSVFLILAPFVNIENLTLTGTGNLNGIGNSLDNVITGNAGRNELQGALGTDTLAGGAGNDKYSLVDSSDTVIEAVGGGIDEVQATSSYTLSANVENLIAATPLSAQNYTGNTLANRIIGNMGHDLLDGMAGADYMAGSGGDDIYYVDSIYDATVEIAGEGTDTVFSSITHTLRVNVDNLTLLGPANINASGNALNNTLVGNAGSNILNGLAGADSMTGGKGNDTYYVDDINDFVSEGVGEGIDSVRSSVALNSMAPNIEKLYLLTGAANALGNVLSNFIYGNAGNNTLDGGLGADRLYGDKGNDEYYLDSAGDLVFETTAGAAGGIDRVISYVNHTLGTNFENLDLLGGGNVNATGNTQINAIRGNAANNFIDGKAASDTLTGGFGLDNFVFSTALGAANVDTIADFVEADDTIRLENAVFAALPVGFLGVATFNTGVSAADASDRIIYNSATGGLFYDPDGLGGAAQVRFATVSTGLMLANTDFFVF